MPHPSKYMPNKVVIPFYEIFYPIKLKKGLIFYISKQDLSSFWLYFLINIKNYMLNVSNNSNLVLKYKKKDLF